MGTNELFDTRYTVFRQDRDTEKTGKKRGGGLVLAAKKEMCITRVPQWDICNHLLELMWFRLKLAGENIYFCLIYIPPHQGSKKEESITHFTESVLSLNLQGESLFIIGDFNLYEFTDEISTRPVMILQDFTNIHLLESLITVRNKKNRTLDLCLTNISGTFQNKNKRLQLDVNKTDGLVKEDGHHPAIEITIRYQNKIKQATSEKKNNETYFAFQSVNIELLNEEIEKVPWDSELQAITCPNLMLDYIYTKLNEVFIQTVPVRKVTQRNQSFPKWWTANTRHTFKTKEKLRKTNNKNSKDSEKYKRLRKDIKKQIKGDHQTYIDNLTQEFKSNSKRFWKYVKNERSKGKATNLSYKGVQLSSQKEIANAFADHFVISFKPSDSNLHENCTDNNNHSNPIELSLFTEQQVLDEAIEMDRNKPAGRDEIPPKIVRDCAQSLCKPLTHLFNLSLKSNLFPDKLKDTIITPVPKTESGCIEDHRPVANLNAFAKLFEALLYKSISDHIFSRVANTQHGFVEGRSTTSNLIELSEYACASLQDGHQTDVILTDVLKGFDQLSHEAIIKKLSSVGFSHVKFFLSYLTNRSLRVKYIKESSEPFIPTSGIAQGSKLSSLLFILTYDDVCKDVSPDSKILLYADDLKIFRKITNIDDCRQLQDDLTKIRKRLHLLGLSFHPSKSKKLTITRNKNKAIKFCYKMGDVIIDEVKYHKDLGIVIDEELKFKQHREDIVRRAFRKLGLIIRFGKLVDDIDVLRTLFLSLVRSTVEYGSVIWSPNSKEDSKLIERVQSTFVRYLFKKANGFYPKYPQAISYDTLIEMLDLNSLDVRRKQDLMMLVYNLINNYLHCPELQDKIIHKTPNPRLRNNKIEPFVVAHPKFTKLHESPLTRAMTLCNTLTLHANEFSLPKDMFKSKCIEYIKLDHI